MAGRCARSVASVASEVRRRSERRPRLTRISCSAVLLPGPLGYVDVRKSSSASRGLRFAAQIPTAIATARSAAAAISSRYDIRPPRPPRPPPPDELLGGGAERFVFVRIAWHGRKKV